MDNKEAPHLKDTFVQLRRGAAFASLQVTLLPQPCAMTRKGSLQTCCVGTALTNTAKSLLEMRHGVARGTLENQYIMRCDAHFPSRSARGSRSKNTRTSGCAATNSMHRSAMSVAFACEFPDPPVSSPLWQVNWRTHPR